MAVETASASGEEGLSGIVSVQSDESRGRRKSGDVLIRDGGFQSHYDPSEAILMGGECTGTSVSSRANEVSDDGPALDPLTTPRAVVS